MPEETEDRSIIPVSASEWVEKISPELTTAISLVESRLAEANSLQEALE